MKNKKKIEKVKKVIIQKKKTKLSWPMSAKPEKKIVLFKKKKSKSTITHEYQI